MPRRDRFEEKADRLQRRYEETALMLNKDQEEYRVTEAVFDRPTLEGIYKLIQQKKIDKIQGVVKSGKEARVYYATASDGSELAVKIYYTSTADFRKGLIKYLEGDPRFKHIRHDIKGIIYAWAQKEYSNLQLAEDAGVNAPRPRAFQRNILVMTFIGANGEPAPLLRETDLEDPDSLYIALLKEMKLLWSRAGLAHGDLSEYNVMVWEEKPIIFDLSQAMLVIHPLAESLLTRDVENINAYFARLGVRIFGEDNIQEWIKGGAEELR